MKTWLVGICILEMECTAQFLVLRKKKAGEDTARPVNDCVVQVYNALYMYPVPLHCKKKKCAMHTKYGVLLLSPLEHFIWRKVTPYFWCVFNTKLGVL